MRWDFVPNPIRNLRFLDFPLKPIILMGFTYNEQSPKPSGARFFPKKQHNRRNFPCPKGIFSMNTRSKKYFPVKPARSYEEQLTRLSEIHDLTIGDPDRARYILSTVNY